MHQVNVLYCFDTNFWRMAAVSIHSLVSNASAATNITVYCMVPPHTRGRRKIKQIVHGQGGRLVWRVVRRHENPFHSRDFSRWSPVIFYRLFAHKIFPELDKILYLDSDTLIQSDLYDLYNTDISEFTIGAVRDMAPTNDNLNKNGIYVKDFTNKYLLKQHYVNSGVLLINTHNIKSYEKQLTQTRIPDSKYPDQDLINVALNGTIKILPLKYNFIPEMPISKIFDKPQADEAKHHFCIAHFYAVKPYFYDLAPKQVYSMFAAACRQINFSVEKFADDEIRQINKKNNNKTIIPFIRLTNTNRITLFGIIKI